MSRLAAAGAMLVLTIAGCVAPAGNDPSASPTSRPSATHRTAAPTPSTLATPGLSPATAQAGEQFLDPGGFYQMTVGDQWVENHGGFIEGVEVWFIGPQVANFRPNVNVITQAVGTTTFEEYTALSVKNAPALMRDFDLISTTEVLGSGGSRLGVMEFTGAAPNGASLQFLAVWTVLDGQAIVGTLTAPPDAFGRLRTEVEPFLLTLTAT